MRTPAAATIVEVGLRDGLQLLRDTVAAPVKLRLLRALYAAGLRAMEVTSFVSPRAVPQFADAEEIARAALDLPGLQARALVPNLRGFERARAVGIREVSFVIGATDEFNTANVRMRVDQSLAQLTAIMDAARADPNPIAVEVGIAVAFGCPYTGRVPAGSVRKIAERAVALGAASINLGDTIGVATPRDVASLVSHLRARHPALPLSLHFHDTHGTGLANVLAGLDEGVSAFDASVGGLGGCPFAPGATGNVATEDVNYMLTGMGIATGVDQAGLLECGRLVRDEITADLASRTLRVHLGRALA
jgi:hydroxymethylglutaryl-CoA lyase